MDFIHAFPALKDRNLGTAIWALRAALEDLNHGRVVAMLAPTRVDSRRPDPSNRAGLARATSSIPITPDHSHAAADSAVHASGQY
jgi:hypothetical protein